MQATQISLEEKMSAICDYVNQRRQEEGIHPTPHVKFELSCFCCGEATNLVTHQLLTTTNGSGAWLELEDPKVLDLAYGFVVRSQQTNRYPGRTNRESAYTKQS